jgi:hypothetical protein
MTHYLLVYHGGKMEETPEEIDKAMAAWGKWMSDMGENVIDPGNPVGLSKTLHPDGSVEDNGGANPASGYSIIKADSEEAALEMAKACPHLQAAGTIEIAPIVEIEV